MDMTQELGSPEIIEFGRFAIVPYRREVLFEGRPIKLGGRAFDMLMVLVEARGNVVSRDTCAQGARGRSRHQLKSADR